MAVLDRLARDSLASFAVFSAVLGSFHTCCSSHSCSWIIPDDVSASRFCLTFLPHVSASRFCLTFLPLLWTDPRSNTAQHCEGCVRKLASDFGSGAAASAAAAAGAGDFQSKLKRKSSFSNRTSHVYTKYTSDLHPKRAQKVLSCWCFGALYCTSRQAPPTQRGSSGMLLTDRMCFTTHTMDVTLKVMRFLLNGHIHRLLQQ